MNETTDQLILARFDAVAPPGGDGDWNEVLSRARPSVAVRRLRPPARAAVAVAVAAVAAATTAVAFGWPGKIVDYFQAPPAPESVAQFFRTFNEAVPKGMNDSAVGQPRAVMTATFDAENSPPTNPIEHTLYVAPRTGGGFCFIWTDAGGGCADPIDATAATTNPGARMLGVEDFQGDYATVTDGYVRGDAVTVEARFADGTSVTLPVTWVSAPIDAGFYVYVVPPAHLNTTDALTSVVALDANGNVVGRDEIGVTQPLDQDVMQTLPDGTKVSLPRRAQASLAKEPFSFRTASGDHAYLWVMPRTDGGSCYLYGTGAGGGFGCISPQELQQLPPLNSNVTGDVYFDAVPPDVAAIELRYANGTTERLTPVDGFVLAQTSTGTQLDSAVALDASGKAVYTERLPQQYHRIIGR